MFTGIIEQVGTVETVLTEGSNHIFWIRAGFSGELKVDQSVAHNGVCLTVDDLREGVHRVTAIAETLSKTNLGHWAPGSLVNLERCLPMNGRLDGHLVQGHVDTVAECTGVTDKGGSWEYRFVFDEKFAPLVIEKGSIALNGTSLTVFNVGRNQFTVAIVPYTYHHTQIHALRPGHWANIEFDMLGKYVQRSLSLR
jgi:riboflavin synthase